MYLLLIHGIGLAGGWAGNKLRIPAGSMIGAMAAVLLLNAATGMAADYPSLLRALVQIGCGCVIGSRFARKDLHELRQIGLPAAILVLMLFAFNVLFAVMISFVSPISMMTSLFACAPGGVSDLALIAVDFGADTEQVTLLQLFRFIFVISFFPPLMKRKYLSGTETARVRRAAVKKAPLPIPRMLGRTAFSLAAASVGGFALRALGVPAGAIIGAIILTIAVNITTQKVLMPGPLKTFLQVCCGVYIGNQVTRRALLSIGTLLLPMLVVVAEVCAMAFGTAYLIHRLTGLNLVTSLFSSIPGGIAEMGVIAEEMGLDTPKIVVMHTCRVILTICVLPILVKLFA